MDDWESINREVWKAGHRVRFYLLNKRTGNIKIVEYHDGKLQENE